MVLTIWSRHALELEANNLKMTFFTRLFLRLDPMISIKFSVFICYSTFAKCEMTRY